MVLLGPGAAPAELELLLRSLRRGSAAAAAGRISPLAAVKPVGASAPALAATARPELPTGDTTLCMLRPTVPCTPGPMMRAVGGIDAVLAAAEKDAALGEARETASAVTLLPLVIVAAVSLAVCEGEAQDAFVAVGGEMALGVALGFGLSVMLGRGLNEAAPSTAGSRYDADVERPICGLVAALAVDLGGMAATLAPVEGAAELSAGEGMSSSCGLGIGLCRAARCASAARGLAACAAAAAAAAAAYMGC